MKHMQALQVVEPRTFKLVQAPIPNLEDDGSSRILVKTEWVSLCGSDIPFFTGSKRYTFYPMAAGAPIHECVGQVIQSNSESFQPGDRVVAIPEGDRGLAEFFVAQQSKAVKL